MCLCASYETDGMYYTLFEYKARGEERREVLIFLTMAKDVVDHMLGSTER